MSVFPKYSKLPVSLPVTVLALLVLMSVLWLQGGFTTMYSHLHLLFASYLIWGMLLPFIQGIVKEVNWKNTKTIVWASINAFVLILIHFVLSNIAYYALKFLFEADVTIPNINEISGFIVPSLLGRVVDFVMFFGLLSWVNQMQTLAAKKVDLADAQALLEKAKLEALKSQLNPHFLFNTLHAIYSQIGENDEKARSITMSISSLLRKTLGANEKEKHSLKQELEIAEEYLAIELARFGQRLKIEYHIDEMCLDIIVPTMVLQPIVENAIKHGVALVEGPTLLTIEIKSINDNVQVYVLNDINTDAYTAPAQKNTGIGLANLQERLKLYYHDNYLLNYGIEKNQFVVTLKIPQK